MTVLGLGSLLLVIIIIIIIIIISYCILRGRIKVLNSDAILCQQVVIALWLGSYRTVVG